MTPQVRLRVYADTSVFGGPFDPEFAAASEAFFVQVRDSRLSLVTSGVVRAEVDPAPAEVRELFAEMLSLAEVVELSGDALSLRDGYLAAGIVTPRYADDALHVALATIASCPVIVSWNFKHIVHYRKIALYNEVNAAMGYRPIGIFSPLEIIDYDDEDV